LRQVINGVPAIRPLKRQAVSFGGQNIEEPNRGAAAKMVEIQKAFLIVRSEKKRPNNLSM
jgi:hypothetical protein